MFDHPEEKGLSLSGLKLFSGAPAPILALIEKACVWHRLASNEVVIDSESPRPHGVFFLVEGRVEVLKHSTDNQFMTVAKLNAPDCFGEFGAIIGKTGSASIRTETDCVVAEISSERFLSLLNACPATSLWLLEKAVSLVKNLGEDSVLLQSAHSALEMTHRNSVLRSL
jgi:CRP-like cAMP-binding protein